MLQTGLKADPSDLLSCGTVRTFKVSLQAAPAPLDTAPQIRHGTVRNGLPWNMPKDIPDTPVTKKLPVEIIRSDWPVQRSAERAASFICPDMAAPCRFPGRDEDMGFKPGRSSGCEDLAESVAAIAQPASSFGGMRNPELFQHLAGQSMQRKAGAAEVSQRCP